MASFRGFPHDPLPLRIVSHFQAIQEAEEGTAVFGSERANFSFDLLQSHLPHGAIQPRGKQPLFRSFPQRGLWTFAQDADAE